MHKRKCLLAIFLLCQIQSIISDYNVTIMLLEFDNGQGLLANGQYCNNLWYENVQCNIALKICVNLATENNDCTISDWNSLQSPPWYDLGQVTNNANNVTFKQTYNANGTLVNGYGGWNNPTTLNGGGTYSGFSISLFAVDVTNGANNLIDSYTYQFSDGNTARDFYYYSHPRNISEQYVTLDPTLTGVAWYAAGDILHPQPTNPPSTVTPTTGPTTAPPPKLSVDCSDPKISVSGVYNITPRYGQPVEVYCDVVSPGQAYTVIQSRGPNNSDIDFNKTWTDYKRPFGKVDKDSNFWIGLDFIHALSNQFNYGLRIDLCCGDTPTTSNDETPLLYAYFKVDDESTKYRMNATALSGPYGIATFTPAYNSDIGSEFSTYDNFTANAKFNQSTIKQPNYCEVLNYPKSTNISATHHGNIGGWWFGSCTNNLNGYYYKYNDPNFADASTCSLNLGPQGLDTGTGVEMSTPLFDKKLPKISYTKVRMALYRFDSNFGESTPPPARSAVDFCSGNTQTFYKV